LRIWDMMFYEGVKIIFKLALFFFKKLEKDLLKADFGGILSCLKEIGDGSSIKDPDALIKEVTKIKLSRRTLIKSAAKYQEKHRVEMAVASGKPEKEAVAAQK